MGKTVKKGFAFLLVFSLLLGMADTSLIVRAGESTANTGTMMMANASTGGAVTGGAVSPSTAPTATPDNAVIVTPFAGQWKYFGQKRKLIRDVHYAVSNEEDLPAGVSLSVSSEDVGKQSYVLTDERAPEDQKPVYRLAANAPTYEIRAYHTSAQAEGPEKPVNIGDRKELADDKMVIAAPEGYKISQNVTADAVWSKDISVVLTEGSNEITYYLSSNLNDATRKAIDQTPKKITIQADWTAPEVKSVTGGDNGTDVSASGQILGSEPGKFYYVVLPKRVADEEEAKETENGTKMGITTSYIQTRVASHYGIVGYGRLDGVKATDFSFNGLAAETEYVIYSYMTDDAGNESAVSRSNVFMTDKIALSGNVEITGTVTVDETLTAKANLDSVDPGELSYQWYRIKRSEDAASFESVLDETGGAEEDDLEAEDDEEDDDDEDDDEDDVYDLSGIHKLAESDSDNVTTVDGATLIAGATKSTYKITRDDIGCRLICHVTAKNYSGYVAGESTTFVPKLIPQITFPVIGSATYSPTRKLSSIRLPENFTWVDSSIVPVYGNSGYRAKFVPENTAIYRTVVVRIKVPVKNKALTKKMIHIKKTHAFTGKAIKNNFYLTDGGEDLELKRDYKATYSKNKNLGKATVTIKGVGNYKGTKKVSYKIVKKSVKSLTCRYQKIKVYNGKLKTAGVVLKNGSLKLRKNKDYTITYRNNIQIGTASIMICGKGNYKGKRTLRFQIVPAKPKIAKVTKKKKSFKLQLSAGKIVKGYIVYVSTSASFAKKKTQEYSMTGNRFGMQGLTKGTYYVRTKCYGVSKGKTYRSSYSKTRKIKIK